MFELSLSLLHTVLISLFLIAWRVHAKSTNKSPKWTINNIVIANSTQYTTQTNGNTQKRATIKTNYNYANAELTNIWNYQLGSLTTSEIRLAAKSTKSTGHAINSGETLVWLLAASTEASSDPPPTTNDQLGDDVGPTIIDDNSNNREHKWALCDSDTLNGKGLG